MSALQRPLEEALNALRRVEWSAQGGTKCPACGRPKAYGAHVCSCLIALAFKAATKAGVPPPKRPDPPAESRGPFTLRELTLADWARWHWLDATSSGDRERQFLRGRERTPDEVHQALEQYARLQEDHPELFAEGSARP